MLTAAAARPNMRYLFVDKIHTLKQHRDEVAGAVCQGFLQRSTQEGRMVLALLNLCHPEDEEGEFFNAAEVCTASRWFHKPQMRLQWSGPPGRALKS